MKMIWSRRSCRLNLSWGDGAKMDSTPVRWSSSERPLSVRTVWVGGMRHAILSLDDPLVQYQGQPYIDRSGSSSVSLESETSSTSSSVINNELEECLVKLRLALDSAGKTQFPPIENSSTTSPSCDPSPCTSPSPPVLQQNPLSERVLQWLDLANKGREIKMTPLLPKRTRNISSCVKVVHPKRKVMRSAVIVDIPDKKVSSPISKTSSKELPQSLHRQSPSIKEEKVLRTDIQTPTILPQRYEPIRPLTAWASTSKPTRPQLHIFIPPMQQTYKTSIGTDCTLYASE